MNLVIYEPKAKLIEFNPLTATDVMLPSGAVFVIANCLVRKSVSFYCRLFEMSVVFLLALFTATLWTAGPDLSGKDGGKC